VIVAIQRADVVRGARFPRQLLVILTRREHFVPMFRAKFIRRESGDNGHFSGGRRISNSKDGTMLARIANPELDWIFSHLECISEKRPSRH